MENILIVEDESIIALELQARVKNFGYQVAGIADRGSTAINKFQQLKPDIILMDINIKGDMDGIETAEKIFKYQKVPIIFITAFSDSATRKKKKKRLHHRTRLVPPLHHFQRHHRHLGQRQRQPIGREPGAIEGLRLHDIRLVEGVVRIHCGALQDAPGHAASFQPAHEELRR